MFVVNYGTVVIVLYNIILFKSACEKFARIPAKGLKTDQKVEKRLQKRTNYYKPNGLLNNFVKNKRIKFFAISFLSLSKFCCNLFPCHVFLCHQHHHVIEEIGYLVLYLVRIGIFRGDHNLCRLFSQLL